MSVSWDAYLVDDRGHLKGDWNYTHNTNGMIAAAYEAWTGRTIEQAAGSLGPLIGAAWWDRLNGLSGDEGYIYLSQIVSGLAGDPERFRAMNPENGWGDYDSILRVLTEMRDAVPNWPTTWKANG